MPLARKKWVLKLTGYLNLQSATALWQCDRSAAASPPQPHRRVESGVEREHRARVWPLEHEEAAGDEDLRRRADDELLAHGAVTH